MKIAIFGIGAIGGYIAGRLTNAGEEVSLISRGETPDSNTHQTLPTIYSV